MLEKKQIEKKRSSIGIITVSLVGVLAISQYEGFREEAYLDIGYGTTQDVKLGNTITKEEAQEVMQRELSVVYGKALTSCVKVPLYQYEYDAYISLAYNIGTSNFCKSTLVKKLNTRDYPAACKEILRWDFAKGKKIKGLTKRREQEFKMCIGGK